MSKHKNEGGFVKNQDSDSDEDKASLMTIQELKEFENSAGTKQLRVKIGDVSESERLTQSSRRLSKGIVTEVKYKKNIIVQRRYAP